MSLTTECPFGGEDKWSCLRLTRERDALRAKLDAAREAWDRFYNGNVLDLGTNALDDAHQVDAALAPDRGEDDG